MKRFNTLLSVWVLIFFIASCATQKSKDDPSKVGKFYHDVTSKYNGYFNANELLEASIETLNAQHQDNYNKILSIYKYSAADNASVVASDLDNAIKKVSIVASLHPASHWKDDCYLLMGQSQFVKKDYESAEETLEFMVDEYDPKNAGKKRKKGKKKKKSKKQKKKEAKEKKKKREATQKEKKKAQEKKRKEKEAARQKRIKASKKKAKQNKKNRKKGKKSSSKKKNEKKEPEVKVIEKAPEVKEEKKEEKKEKDESGNYFLKHKPAFQEGVLWLARTYIERDKFDQASRLIDRLKTDPKTFSEIKRDLAPVEADFYLKQKKYAQAIAPLERAISLTKNKTNKARYAYIVGQLNQKLGQGEEAYAYFEKAKKYSRDYEMRFSSQLNMETNAWLNGKATAAETITRLNKMLKNDKNEEYQDQIHYALASIYLKTNQTKDAIANLQLSLNKSETNPAQKAESYLLLAQLFFQDENYVSSKNYYDSTLLVMAKTDDRYFEAQKYATSLTEIAANIQIIELQDSLLRISTLSDDEKRKIAAKIKKEEAALAAQNTKPKTNKGSARPNLRPGNRPNQFQEASTWVFYDEKKVRKGKRSFEKKWGNRKMEDDWRRSNRRGASQADEEIVEDVVEEGSDLTDDEIAKILGDVPKTPDEIAEVKGKVKDALYQLGTLYRDRLENNEKAVETLGKLEKRFPGNNHELNAWYYQYLSYIDLTQQPTAKIYKDKIIGKYPESTYAKVLNGNAIAFENEEQKLKNYYKDTYSDFVNLDYKKAYDKVGRVEEIFGEKNPLQPKFALLSSMCIGNLQGRGEYVKSLKEVVAKFPDTPEQSRAKEILRLLGELKEDPTIPKEGNAGGKFKLQDKKVHYMIVVLKGGKIELGDAKIKVSNYNREFHKSDKLRISNIYLGADTNTPILVVRRFKNKEKAITYFQGIMANKKKFLGDNNDYEVFAVTQHNYREILKAKSIEGYREFFNKNYK
ncbi:MAG: tetratricopeptide repeat protein [Saprospiraceae bacterium]